MSVICKDQLLNLTEANRFLQPEKDLVFSLINNKKMHQLPTAMRYRDSNCQGQKDPATPLIIP